MSVQVEPNQVMPDPGVVVRKNVLLAKALRSARDRIEVLQERIDQLETAPLSAATVIAPHPMEHQADVLVGGRRMRVAIGDSVLGALLEPGQEVLLNENLALTTALGTSTTGEIVTAVAVLPHRRVLVRVRNDEERVLRISGALQAERIRPGDTLRAELATGFAHELLERPDTEDLLLEEIPNTSYADIGGLGDQIEVIRDAVELPLRHPELYREHQLRPPKGLLLYGPPGCGKTLIARAVATSLARTATPEGGTAGLSYFLNVKGPELLTKYVGETERQIRHIFSRARQRASHGIPVVIFFDEMDSLFRTRGTGRSSDVETTIVPQLLAEIDGVESLENVLIIGASNREDMIDPAILRPGRLDVKIRISRPDRQASADILAKYLHTDLPIDPREVAEFGSPAAAVTAMIEDLADAVHAETPQTEYVEVTYASGDREVLHIHDFASGAMLANIVARAKKYSIKERLAGGQGGLSRALLLRALATEVRENEDLPSTTNPDEWARVSGRRGERVSHMRVLTSREPELDSAPAPAPATAGVHKPVGILDVPVEGDLL